METWSLICLLSACAVLADACTSSDAGNVKSGAGGGTATGGAGHGTGTGGGSAGSPGWGSGGEAAGGFGGVAGASGRDGGAGSGAAAGRGGADAQGGAGGTDARGGHGGADAQGGHGGQGSGAISVCDTNHPCPGGKVCVTYSCGPIPQNILPCTPPSPRCIDNPCDGGACATCPPTVCDSYGICSMSSPAFFYCTMPG